MAQRVPKLLLKVEGSPSALSVNEDRIYSYVDDYNYPVFRGYDLTGKKVAMQRTTRTQSYVNKTPVPSPDGRCVGFFDGNISDYNLVIKRYVRDEGVFSFNKNGDTVVFSDGYQLRILATNDTTRNSFHDEDQYFYVSDVTSAKFSPVENIIFLGKGDSIRIVNCRNHWIKSFHIYHEKLQEYDIKIKDFDISPDGKRILVNEGYLTLWDLNGNRLLMIDPGVKMPIPNNVNYFDHAVFSPKGDLILAYNETGIYVYDMKGKQVDWIRPVDKRSSLIEAISMTKDQKRMLISCGSYTGLYDLTVSVSSQQKPPTPKRK